MKKIVKLSSDVVAKIAAGEVVHRPSNVVKEMIENSLDAGATRIRVSTREGGLKYLLVEDNGSGISLEDLPLLCARHCTSKLTDYADLKVVKTFGFRGEAMASVSHVAHVALTTFTPDAPCAYEAKYVDGKMISEPKPKAGRPGTAITIEDLFYNVSTRRKSLAKYPRDEFKRIVEVIRCYSLCYPNVSWMVKELEGSGAEVATQGDQNVYQVVSGVFGKQAGSEVLPISLDLMQEFDASVDGFVTNGRYNGAKTEIVTFVNGRLVESKPLRTAAASAFKAVFSGGDKVHPLVFLQLRIAPQHVDVNVDPNKRFVHFLNEQQIAERIKTRIADTLAAWKQASDPSVSFTAGTVVNARKRAAAKPNTPASNKGSARPETAEKAAAPARKKRRSEAPPPPTATAATTATTTAAAVVVPHETEPSRPSGGHPALHALRQRIAELEDTGASRAVRSLGAAFSISPGLCLAEHSEELLLVDLYSLCRELCFQFCVHNAPQFQTRLLRSPMSLQGLLAIALASKRSGFSPEDGDLADIAAQVAAFLVDKAPVLQEVAGITVSQAGLLERLPVDPLGAICFEGLPLFFMQLAYDVDWSSENESVAGILRQVSYWMSPTVALFGPFPVPICEDDAVPMAQRITYTGHRVDEAFKLCALYPDSYVWAQEGSTSVFVQGIGAFFECAKEDQRFSQLVHPSRPCRFFALYEGSPEALQRLFSVVESQWKQQGGAQPRPGSRGNFRYRQLSGGTYVCVSDSIIFRDVYALGEFMSCVGVASGHQLQFQRVHYEAGEAFPVISSDFHPHYRVDARAQLPQEAGDGNYARATVLAEKWLSFTSSWAPFKAPKSFLQGVLTKMPVERLDDFNKPCTAGAGGKTTTKM